MLALYRTLLHLYPATYRSEFGEEMMEVLSEVQAETRKMSALAKILSGAREAAGLLYGALQEHLRSVTGSYSHVIFSPFSLRRFAMKSEFRFPKATVGLMIVILAAIMFAIEKARAISLSVPHANPPVGHIHPTQMAIVPALLVPTIAAIAVGLIGWGILHALHRSGIQQLSEMKPSPDARLNK